MGTAKRGDRRTHREGINVFFLEGIAVITPRHQILTVERGGSRTVTGAEEGQLLVKVGTVTIFILLIRSGSISSFFSNQISAIH